MNRRRRKGVFTLDSVSPDKYVNMNSTKVLYANESNQRKAVEFAEMHQGSHRPVRCLPCGGRPTG